MTSRTQELQHCAKRILCILIYHYILIVRLQNRILHLLVLLFPVAGTLVPLNVTATTRTIIPLAAGGLSRNCVPKP